MSKRAPDYRFLAIREPLRELDLGDAEQLPFRTMSFGAHGVRLFRFGPVPIERQDPPEPMARPPCFCRRDLYRDRPQSKQIWHGYNGYRETCNDAGP